MIVIGLLLFAGQGVSAQDLPLKRELPTPSAFECAPFERAIEPTVEARAEAASVAAQASEARILGDRARASELLTRAALLDPRSADYAYRLARILEELGESDTALGEYCRALSIEPDGLNAADARGRVSVLSASAAVSLPTSATTAFANGVALAELGRMEDALAGFDRAAAEVPDWPDPHYNRGVLLLEFGRVAEAEAAFVRYLELAPDAPDVIAVSRRIGAIQAQRAAPAPSAGGALTLGVLPGLGQIYTHRPAEGLAYLGLAGASTATAFLYERGDGRSFYGTGLVTAGTVTAIGALDAYMYARRQRQLGTFDPDPGTAFVLGILPGLGQSYGGRHGTGLAFLAITTWTVALSDIAEFGEDRRFVTPGLGVAGGVWFLGGMEAYLHERLRRSDVPPDPWAAFGLGLIPGLGQFYAGRTGMGMVVMTIAAAGTATAFLYEEGRGRGLFAEGLTLAGVTAGVGAIEAAFGARRVAREWPASRPGPASGGGGFALNEGSATLYGPALAAAGPREFSMRLLALTF